VHDEESLRNCGVDKLTFVGEDDEKIDEKNALELIVYEFRSIIQSSLSTRRENDVIMQLVDAQNCCRIVEGIKWEIMFDESISSPDDMTDKLNELNANNANGDEISEKDIELNEHLFIFCRCCIFGYRKFVMFQDFVNGTNLAEQNPTFNSVVSLIFEQPYFLYDLQSYREQMDGL